MIVYVLIQTKDHYGDSVLGIFHNEDAALDKAREQPSSVKISYTVVEFEVEGDE